MICEAIDHNSRLREPGFSQIWGAHRKHADYWALMMGLPAEVAYAARNRCQLCKGLRVVRVYGHNGRGVTVVDIVCPSCRKQNEPGC